MIGIKKSFSHTVIYKNDYAIYVTNIGGLTNMKNQIMIKKLKRQYDNKCKR